MGAFLCLFIDVGEAGTQFVIYEKIGVCNFAALFQIVQMLLSLYFEFAYNSIILADYKVFGFNILMECHPCLTSFNIVPNGYCE